MARSRNPSRQSTRHASNLSEQLLRTLRESALWVFGALAFVLWLALFSYDASDPGFTQASGSGDINNAVGRIGALVADLLFNLFGRPAYLFTVMVSYFGWVIFREQDKRDELTRADYSFRIGGFLAMLVTSCALASLHFSPLGFRESAGGIVGLVVGGWLESMLKLLSASVLLFFVWIASISVLISLMKVSALPPGRISMVAEPTPSRASQRTSSTSTASRIR